MKRNRTSFISLLTLMLAISFSFAQKEANIWYFGNNIGVDFNTGSPPSPLSGSSLLQYEGCATICDANGGLLFYTGGSKIWDRNHNQMPSGFGLLGEFSSTQTVIITPVLGNKNRYYVLTVDGITTSNNGPLKKWDGVKYSIVDMTLNGGMGDIVPGWKNRALVDSTREQITAAKHANGIDYWLITRKQFTNEYYAFLVTCNGIDTANPVISKLGSTAPNNTYNALSGYLKVSPNNDAIVSAFNGGTNELYDFDNSTGVLSNAVTLTNDQHVHYGASFSPDGSVVYISGSEQVGRDYIGRIYRYNMNAANIPGSEIITTFSQSSIQALQIGSDGKIYFPHCYGGHNDSLGAILNPNNFANPNIQYNYVDLGGGLSELGLPNYFETDIFEIKTFAGRDTIACANQPVSIGSNPYPGLSYFWLPAAGIANPTSALTTASVDTTTFFILGAYYACDTIYDTVKVDVLSTPNIEFSMSDTSGCAPLCVSFDHNLNNVTSSKWRFGTGDSSYANPPVSYCYTKPGEYQIELEITTADGCITSDTGHTRVMAHPKPTASFTTYPNPATLLTSPLQFINTSTGASKWLWQFDDGNLTTSTLQNPYHIFDELGEYRCRLIVANEWGCLDTTYDNVKIFEDYVIYIPNTFTPNGDNLNDVFLPKGVGISEEDYKLLIFDRWGNLIFETDQLTRGWDGRANGGSEIAQQDVYVWKILTKDIMDIKHQYIGRITLLK